MKKNTKQPSQNKALGVLSLLAGLVIGYLCFSTGELAFYGFGILMGGSFAIYGLVLFLFNISLSSIFENWIDAGR